MRANQHRAAVMVPTGVITKCVMRRLVVKQNSTASAKVDFTAAAQPWSWYSHNWRR